MFTFIFMCFRQEVGRSLWGVGVGGSAWKFWSLSLAFCDRGIRMSLGQCRARCRVRWFRTHWLLLFQSAGIRGLPAPTSDLPVLTQLWLLLCRQILKDEEIGRSRWIFFFFFDHCSVLPGSHIHPEDVRSPEGLNFLKAGRI